MRNPSFLRSDENLQFRIKHFIDSTRVGLDLGEWTGGIAVVRGNEIVHAETYLDFHKQTIEDRRQLRRGRRTRNARRKRLARLRSWILRHKLPDGTRLPDPYNVMHSEEFWTKPDGYRKKGKDPVKAVDWIEKARRGQVAPEGFVRALTIIFRKRGYSWDGIDIHDMTDAELKEFLDTARVPKGSSEYVQQAIDLRRSDPKNPLRGKKKITPEELEKALNDSMRRERKPRTAEHRQVRLGDIEDVVRGFGNYIGLPAQEQKTWITQLQKLLDKPVRKARFQNRIKITCAWCGKPTPRKSKVREISYLAAVNNLRTTDETGIKRKLNDEEIRVFVNWWNAEKRPGITKIKSTMKKMGIEQDMANQLYDLLRNDNPKGRASLCRKHLEDAANGKTMKDAGIDWHTAKNRKLSNPSREQHDRRILDRLEKILFVPGEKGAAAWRHGEVKFITLEVPMPQTKKSKKGKRPERQKLTLKERLFNEIGGVCLYTGTPLVLENVEIEHVFPSGRGGPDLTENFTVTTREINKVKADRTPYEWLGGDPKKWAEYRRRVENIKLPKQELKDRKHDILLNEKDHYPDNPTPLARAGARYRQFVTEISALFRKYGVAPPTLEYKSGVPHIQKAAGLDTSRLRESWRLHSDGSENFPEKDRFNLFNHAQDAALVAALPPHTWRPVIWRKNRIELPPEEPGGEPRTAWPFAVTTLLAPDWAAFDQKRTRPVTRIIGNYNITWSKSFADQNFYKIYSTDVSHYSNLTKRYPITKYKVGKTTLADPHLQNKIERIARAEGIPQGKELTPEAIEQLGPENYRPRNPTRKGNPLGGLLCIVRPEDGPPRLMQFKGVSEGCLVWKTRKGKKETLHLSRLRPKALQKLGVPRIDPPLEKGAEVVGQLFKYQVLYLPEKKNFPEGFYIVKEFGKSGVEVFPEWYYPSTLLSNSERKDRPESISERKLGKTELAGYFENRKKEKGKNGKQN